MFVLWIKQTADKVLAKRALLYLLCQRPVMVIHLFRHESESPDQSLARHPDGPFMSAHVTVAGTATTFSWNNIWFSYLLFLAENG